LCVFRWFLKYWKAKEIYHKRDVIYVGYVAEQCRIRVSCLTYAEANARTYNKFGMNNNLKQHCCKMISEIKQKSKTN
jgi:hypothetical protein